MGDRELRVRCLELAVDAAKASPVYCDVKALAEEFYAFATGQPKPGPGVRSQSGTKACLGGLAVGGNLADYVS